MIEPENKSISIAKQCSLIGLERSSYYYHPLGISQEDIMIMNEIDKIHTRIPFYGYPRMTVELKRLGYEYNRKKIARLMQVMDIQAIYPKRNLSKRNQENMIYPYLLRNMKITKNNLVWSSDITYIPMYQGFAYLTAVIDWFSRYILGWAISNTLDVYFCMEALEKALRNGKPEIFNTDQGSQFTSKEFTGAVLRNKIKMSMDSRGRALDNIFIERFWRSLKYENIYLNDYSDMYQLYKGLEKYFNFYNTERPHQALNYRTPAEIYLENR